MKPFAILLLTLLCLVTDSRAQTYMDHLRKGASGQGIVTVNQDKEIDELVNGKAPEATTVTTGKEKTNGNTAGGKITRQPVTTNTDEPNDSEHEEENVDTRKKVMRGAVKVTGYRVQVYAGGNSRTDRQKAEQIGNEVKRKFPDYPVYVHFYSPRWICRMGNFRTIEEANTVLREIQQMGYKSACVVKGTITVQQ